MINRILKLNNSRKKEVRKAPRIKRFGTGHGRISNFIVPFFLATFILSPLLPSSFGGFGNFSSKNTKEIIPSMCVGNFENEEAQSLSEPAQVYFDADDYEVTEYFRGEDFLMNRGGNIDSEDLLFGSVEASDLDEGLDVPPDMTFTEDKTTIFVHSTTLNMREKPTSNSQIIYNFKSGDSFIRTGVGVEWSRVVDSKGRTGYVFTEYTGLAKPTPMPTPVPKYTPPKKTAPAKANTIGESIVKEAYKYLGVRYRWANADPSVGFDCSGLTWYVYGRYGIDVPRGSSSYKNAGTVIPYSQIKPGDIIAWKATRRKSSIDHVGIYVGNGMMIHASSSNKKVVLANVNKYASYSKTKLVSVHRFYKD